jgi:DNA-binding MarR family transcriptional regulator
MRIASDLGREAMLATVHEAGHSDVTEAMFQLFRYPGMDGRRPGEIATTARLSKQATNDMLRELEHLGYVRRRSDPTDGRARILKLTKRGRSLETAIRLAAKTVEERWRKQIDAKRWTAFNDVLDRLIAERPHF